MSFQSLPALLILLVACSQSASKDKPEQPLQGQTKQSLNAPQDAALPSKSHGDLGYGPDAKLFKTASLAIAHIIESHPKNGPRVLGFGEFHKLNSSAPVRSALRQFAGGIIDLLADNTSDLVLESWTVDPKCGRTAKAVTKQVKKTIERPAETESEMQLLARKVKGFGIRGHALEFECAEYKGLLVDGQVDHTKLLTAVNGKLASSTKMALKTADKNKMLIIYGGATHNNLSPYEGLESWSYGPEIAKITNDGYIEIDLYVPELVQGDTLLKTEAWYSLLAEARTDQVILIRRSSHSYIILMRKEFAE